MKTNTENQGYWLTFREKMVCQGLKNMVLFMYKMLFMYKKVKKLIDKIGCPSGPPGPLVYLSVRRCLNEFR